MLTFLYDYQMYMQYHKKLQALLLDMSSALENPLVATKALSRSYSSHVVRPALQDQAGF